MMLRTFVVFLFGASPVLAFTTGTSLQDAAAKFPRPVRPHNYNKNHIMTPQTTATSLRLTELELPVEAMTARGDCVFWFFGASGAAGIARSAFPDMFRRFTSLQKLKGVGPSKGGEMVGLNTLACLYPQDLYKADVDQVVQNPLSAAQIVAKFAVPDNYLASKGYLHSDAFQQANANANPLAVRAVFETFGQGTVDPVSAQEKLDTYKSGNLQAFKSDLTKNKVVGSAAIITLLFLLGIADIIAFSDVQQGWFPEWPGHKQFPLGMFLEQNGSPFTIPEYWI